MQFDDISFLVSETLGHAENGEFSRDKSFYSAQKLSPPSAPGIFYHLQQTGAIFVIRMFVSSDLKEDYNQIVNAPDDYPSLRLVGEDGDVNWDGLKFFECDRSNFARTLKMQLSNKRFPLHEENVINISDPSYSWWVQDSGDDFKIFFKLSHTEKMRSLKKIGPLYDSQVATERFSKLYGYLSMLFPIDDFSSGHGELAISCQNFSHPHYQSFKELFISGEPEHDFWEHLRHLEYEASVNGAPYLKALQEANYFIMELSTVRKFWNTIQSELKNN